MSIDYWQPSESKKAKGYFIRREHRGEVQLGDVYHARLEDAQKACDRLNAMLKMPSVVGKRNGRSFTMTNFASLRLSDQLIVMLSVFIVFIAVATMIVVGSHSLKRWLRNRLIGLVIIIERINDKWFDDDEAFNEEWMDRDAWERTRIPR